MVIYQLSLIISTVTMYISIFSGICGLLRSKCRMLGFKPVSPVPPVRRRRIKTAEKTKVVSAAVWGTDSCFALG